MLLCDIWCKKISPEICCIYTLISVPKCEWRKNKNVFKLKIVKLFFYENTSLRGQYIVNSYENLRKI